MLIATVVEGPTDRIVLESLLESFFPGKKRFLRLQPAETLGELGSGWKGVRKWCIQSSPENGLDLETLVGDGFGEPIDLLVIHLDGSVCWEEELQEELGGLGLIRECPPIQPIASLLASLVQHWLLVEHLPQNVLLAIPAQDTETWAFAALFPDDPLCVREDFECLRSGADYPAYRLTLARYRGLLSRHEGTIKKRISVYSERIAPQIVERWRQVVSLCSQAMEFDRRLQDLANGMGGEAHR